jgi:Arc/MetJ family transcription regulator
LILCEPVCRILHMATNLSIDPKLLDRALEVSGEKTKKAAVTIALKEFIARREQKRLLELFGKLEWDPDYDYKAERARQ